MGTDDGKAAVLKQQQYQRNNSPLPSPAPVRYLFEALSERRLFEAKSC